MKMVARSPEKTVAPVCSNPRATMNRKPVLIRENACTVLTLDNDEFRAKGLCGAAVLNLGDTCAFSCEYCYVPSVMNRVATPVIRTYNERHGTSLGLRDVVVRRKDAIELLRAQLLHKDGSPRFTDEADQRVVFSSSVVDIGANGDLLAETAQACNLILKHTKWQIRLLSKSSRVRELVEKGMLEKSQLDRVIFGFSTGTLDDKLAAAIETGTARVSERIKALRWLQDEGFRTFGMICPSLPQEDYHRFSREICDAICAERCEHVWAEVINLRDDSLNRTVAALRAHGFAAEAERVAAVSGDGAAARWEKYAQQTFEAHAKVLPPGKLRFLQYVTNESRNWWKSKESEGAILLGVASAPKSDPGQEKGGSPAAGALPKAQVSLVAAARASVCAELDEEVRTGLSTEDRQKRAKWEDTVRRGLSASVEAAKALFLIKSYKDGILWAKEFDTFEAYCRSKWDYRKTHAYRLVAAGEFVVDLENSPIGESTTRDWFPRNESQVRPLLSLPNKEARIQCWTHALDGKSAAELTGKKVGSIARELAREAGWQLHDRKRPDHRRAAHMALDHLERAVRPLKGSEQITRLIDKIRALV